MPTIKEIIDGIREQEAAERERAEESFLNRIRKEIQRRKLKMRVRSEMTLFNQEKDLEKFIEESEIKIKLNELSEVLRCDCPEIHTVFNYDPHNPQTTITMEWVDAKRTGRRPSYVIFIDSIAVSFNLKRQTISFSDRRGTEVSRENLSESEEIVKQALADAAIHPHHDSRPAYRAGKNG